MAGVLKLYFRGLEKPLFPEESFSQLMDCVRKTIYPASPADQAPLHGPAPFTLLWAQSDASLSLPAIENVMERVAQIRTVILTYPGPVVVVMRYLFAFLNQ